MKRAIISLVAGAALMVSPTAFAASGPLAPGKAAGVEKAEGFDNNTWLAIAGGALVVAGLVVVLSNGGNGHGTTTTCDPTTTGASCSGGGGTGGTTGTGP